MNFKAIVAAIGAAGMLLAGLGATTAASAAPVIHRSYSMPRIQTMSPYGWGKHTATGR